MKRMLMEGNETSQVLPFAYLLYNIHKKDNSALELCSNAHSKPYSVDKKKIK